MCRPGSDSKAVPFAQLKVACDRVQKWPFLTPQRTCISVSSTIMVPGKSEVDFYKVPAMCLAT